MYPKVKYPKNQREGKRAFAPLQRYLEKECPDEATKILGYMMFMGNEQDKFVYKNSITRDRIVFDQAGQLLYLGESSLLHEFDWHGGQERTPVVLDYVHPNVDKWLERALRMKKVAVFQKELRFFLQLVWGPMANYDFSDLKTEYPLKGKGSPFCLYLYPSAFNKQIAFQFVGDEIVERKCSMKQYNTYMESERGFMLNGWQVTTLIREVLESEPELSMTRKVIMKTMEMADWRIDDDTVFELTRNADRLNK